MIFKIVIVCVLCILAVAILYLAGLLIYASIQDFHPEEIEETEISGKGLDQIPTSDTLHLITWNIGYAGLGKEMDFFYEGGKQVRPSRDQNDEYFDGIIDFLEKQKKQDFILLQEADLDSKRSYGTNQVLKVSKKFPLHVAMYAINYKSAYVPVPWFNSMGKVESGMAVFSRFQPIEALRYSTPGNYSWPESLFMLKRCILYSRYKTHTDNDLVVMNIHNSAFEGEDSLRMAELQMIRDLALKEFEKGNYVVIGGDWNQNPPGWNGYLDNNYKAKIAWPIQTDYMPSEWKWAFDPSVPTNRGVTEPFDKSSTETTILDYFLISPNLELLEVKTLDMGFEFSDHHPVQIKLKLK